MIKCSINTIQKFKYQKKKFDTLTAYDYTSARLVDAAGIPLILVGDSASMVMYGYETTIPVTVEEMVLVVSAVSKGAKNALVVADMPFMSYQTSIEEALKNAGIFVLCLKLCGSLIHFAVHSLFNFSSRFLKSGPIFL